MRANLRRLSVLGFCVLLIASSSVASATEFRPFKKLRNDIKEVVAAVEALMQQVFDLGSRVDSLEAANGTVAVTVDCAAGQTITAALGTVAERLTITVLGTCTENVSINRDDVTLLAGVGGAAVVAPNPAVAGINILGDRVTVDGLAASGGSSAIVTAGATRFLIRNCTAGPSNGGGIVVFQGSQGSVEGCTVQNNPRDGIAIVSAVATVIGNTVTSNGRAGILISTGGKSNIGLINGGGANGNIITNNGSVGIYITFSSTALMGANTITGNGTNPAGAFGRSGINVLNSSADVGFGNIITGNFTSGIQATGSTLLVGDGALGPTPNVISGNGVAGIPAAGISVNLASSATLINAVVENNGGSGVSLALRSNAQIIGGAIRNNRADGVLLQTGAAAVVLGQVQVTANGGTGINCLGTEASLTLLAGVTGNAGGDVGPGCTGF